MPSIVSLPENLVCYCHGLSFADQEGLVKLALWVVPGNPNTLLLDTMDDLPCEVRISAAYVELWPFLVGSRVRCRMRAAP
jgi:hypothetical protein